jgi:ABC-type branched-subunit amino acid transport system substrate-binding protein
MARARLTCVAIAIASVALAACSSGGGSNSPSDGKSSTPAQTFTGEVKIGLTGSTSTVTVLGNPAPELVSAANAAADAINAAGGINGKKLVIDACDDKGNANGGAQCGRQMVADKVVAEVGDQTFFSANLNPPLVAAGISRIGPTALGATEYTVANNYPLNGGAVVMFQGAVKDAAAHGYKSLYVLYQEAEGSGTIPSLIQPVVASTGMVWKGKTGVPLDATDMSPYVTAAMHSGADVVLTTFAPPTTEAIAKTAVQLGAKFKLATLAEALDADVIAAVGKDQPIIQSAMLASPFPPISATQIEGIAQYKKEMDAREKSGDIHASAATRSHVLSAWASVHAFAEIAKSITGPIDAASVTAAVKATKDLPVMDLMPPWTPTNKASAMLPSISNGAGWYIKVDSDGKQVLDNPNYQPILDPNTSDSGA